MGNSNSGQVNVTQGPPLWTQSLPRDAHRKRKSEKIQGGTKVLPERIPGQRLKPTENGRNLHVQGTISTRKLSEVSHPPPDYLSPLQQSPNHHSSMTALNNPNNLPPSSLYPPNNESNHSSRLGGKFIKVFCEEVNQTCEALLPPVMSVYQTVQLQFPLTL
ncbi:hypothetical protein Avbf_08396 [Armadillidium vulgare]|nr:hypothetical protein Avbf_08396 [Armadillidium vulgare]